MSRHLYGAAALFVAVIADAAVVSFPQGGLMINSPNVAAYNYDNDPFQCTTPTVQLNVNATHAWMLITTYSQSSSDARAGTTPKGRAQWAWSTFVNSVANPPSALWDPVSNNPTIATMSTSATGGPTRQPAKDAFRWDGSCAVGTNNAGASLASTYQTVGDITIAPAAPIGTTPLRTRNLAPYTFQAAGCSCGAYAMTSTGVVVDLVANASMTATNTYPCSSGTDNDKTSDVFYTVSGNSFNGLAPAVISGQVGVTQANKTNGWTMRQSTCGSSWRDDLGAGCSTAGTGASAYSYYTGVATVPGGTCSLKTEALLIMPVEQFIVRLTDSGAIVRKSAGSVLSYTWKEYVVEYASTKGTDVYANGGVDAYQTRVTPSSFQINLYPAGAVVQSLAVGAVAPPMMMHTTATGSAGAVSWAQRDPVDGNVLQMTWQYDSFVQQSPLTSATSGPDTLFMTSLMASSSSATVAPGTADLSLGPQLVIAPTSSTNSIYADSYQWTCNKWSTTSADQNNLATMAPSSMMQVNGAVTSGYSCASANCQPVAQSSLPADLLTGLTSAAVNAGSYWVQYHVTVACTVTANWTVGTPWTVSQPFNLPATTIKMGYRLTDTQGSELTDTFAPPFSEIVQVGYASPGVASQDVSFQVQTRLVQLDNTAIKNAPTLSDLIYTTEQNPIPSVMQYSAAMALKVQIVDTTPTQAIRSQWQLLPALMVMVVHDINQAGYTPISQDYVQLSPGNTLPASWCGLDQTAADIDPVTGVNSGGPVMGVWAVVDSRADPTVSDNSGTFLAGWQTANSSTLGYTVTKLGPQYNNIGDGLSPDLQNELGYLLNNNAFSDIESLQSDITTGGTITSFVATATDATGGFAFPLRNRFIVNGKASGYQLSFCTITQAVPYLPQASGACVAGTGGSCIANYPLYATAAAATADTMAYQGTVFPPLTYISPTTSIKYYMPALPASTGGVMCHDGGAMYSAITQSAPTMAGATTVFQSSDDSDPNNPCKSLILPAKTQMLTNEGNSNQGGRRLLSNKYPVHQLWPGQQIKGNTYATATATAFSVSVSDHTAAGGSPPLTPRATTTKVSIQPFEVVVSPSPQPPAAPALSPPVAAPAPQPAPLPASTPLPVPSPIAVPAPVQVGRNGPLPNATFSFADEAALWDIQNKVKAFTNKTIWLTATGTIGGVMFILCIAVCVTYRYTRSTNVYSPAGEGFATQPGGGAAKTVDPNAQVFRGSAFRPFGSGPARMQWRAY